MTTHHKVALLVIAIAASLDFCAGVLFAVFEHISIALGLYWAVATATTVGFENPTTRAGFILATIVELTIIPLVSATFSLFTSGLTASHVRKSEERIKQHVEDKIKEHRGN